MKKNILLSLAIIFSLFSTNLNAGTLRYNPESVTKSIGNQWQMDIIFDGAITAETGESSNSAGLLMFYHDFRYDPSVVRIDYVSFGNWAKNDWGPSATLTYDPFHEKYADYNLLRLSNFRLGFCINEL